MIKSVTIAVWLAIFIVTLAAYLVGWRVGNNKAKLDAENATYEHGLATWGKAINGFGTGVNTTVGDVHPCYDSGGSILCTTEPDKSIGGLWLHGPNGEVTVIPWSDPRAKDFWKNTEVHNNTGTFKDLKKE